MKRTTPPPEIASDEADSVGRLGMSAPRPVRATPGWPPVAIPGRPGWWRHYIDGQQVDLPTRETQAGGDQ